MASQTATPSQEDSSKYCWEIFHATGVRRTQLTGTPYRYWSAFAITYALKRWTSKTIDFLDAGGKDGGTLELLKNLSLQGTYTCMDLSPKMAPATDRDFEIKVIQSAFKDFQPPRQYDVILFQSCLECVESFTDLAWLRRALKPGGFVIATIACKDTHSMYRGYWADGGRYLRDEKDLAPAFAETGLRIVWACPLGGVASRLYHHVAFSYPVDFAERAFRKLLGMVFPKWKGRDPVAPLHRVANALLARIDRLLPYWRTGHLVVAERAN